jgi:hypothetical protein
VTRDDSARRTRTRLLAALGLAWGVTLLLRPREVVARLCPEFPRSLLWVVRVLGVRLLVQHGAVLAAPEAPLVRVASGVELLHAASMVPLLRSARYRRAALVSGAVAAVSAAVLPAVALPRRAVPPSA